MSFAIGIPTLNRYDLLMPTLIMYARDFYDVDIFVLDNGKQKIKEFKNIKVIETDSNIGVGASWNCLCSKVFEKHENALILNDDIYMGKKTVDILDLISHKRYKNELLRATPDWCSFIISKAIWNKVGQFDECFFPAYYEDKSYEYRMKLNGLAPIKTPLLNPYIYRASQTLEKDFSVLEASKRNKELYIKMWGGVPDKEKFKKQYGK